MQINILFLAVSFLVHVCWAHPGVRPFDNDEPNYMVAMPGQQGPRRNCFPEQIDKCRTQRTILASGSIGIPGFNIGGLFNLGYPHVPTVSPYPAAVNPYAPERYRSKMGPLSYMSSSEPMTGRLVPPGSINPPLEEIPPPPEYVPVPPNQKDCIIQLPRLYSVLMKENQAILNFAGPYKPRQQIAFYVPDQKQRPRFGFPYSKFFPPRRIEPYLPLPPPVSGQITSLLPFYRSVSPLIIAPIIIPGLYQAARPFSLLESCTDPTVTETLPTKSTYPPIFRHETIALGKNGLQYFKKQFEQGTKDSDSPLTTPQYPASNSNNEPVNDNYNNANDNHKMSNSSTQLKKKPLKLIKKRKENLAYVQEPANINFSA